MAEQIYEHNAYDEYISNMASYSIVVIRRRAVADITDSLKPIHRRIIYDIYNNQKQGLTKSAKIAGSVVGLYSPHGDASAYGAFKGIINWFDCKLPLLEGHGNFGTLSGMPPAASRYTEAKLSQFCRDVMIDELGVDKHVVDYSPNYDNTTVEPDYLPCKIPLLLINGSSGIAVGISSSIPTHNPNEVIEVARKLLRDSNAPFVLIPDQCQPTHIIDTDWKKLNECGGVFRVRGLTEFGEHDGYPAIFIKSLPDGVTSDKIYDTVQEMGEKKQVPMIKNIIDTTGEQVNIIIQLQKGADPYFVRDLLYKKTQLETTISVNFEVIDGIESKNMSYREYFLTWIEKRKTMKNRLHNLRLNNISSEAHTLSTYVQAMESGYIDEIIGLIRRQKKVDDTNAITEFIITKCKMTKLQAEFLLKTDLRHLAAGYLPIYKDKLKKLESEYKETEQFILNPNKVIEEIDQELAEIANKYGMPRLATVIKPADDSNIPKGTFKIVVTEHNFVRKLLLDERANSIRGDNPKYILKVENIDNILLFDNKGKVFKYPVHKINVTDKSSAGIDLKLLIRNCTADIAAVINETVVKEVLSMKSKHFITTVTKKNFIKNMDLEDFENVPAAGMIYTKLTEGDTVMDVIIAPAGLDAIIYSGHKALRVPVASIPVYKRASQGVIAMNTQDDISGLSLVYPDAQYIVIATESGRINKFDIAGLAQDKRAKSGNKVVALKGNDRIVSIFGVTDNNHIMIICNNARHTMQVSDIPVGSSISAGVKLIEPKDGNIVKLEIVG